LQAIKLYLEGNSLRSIGRILKVTHQSVSNWIEAYSQQLPPSALPEKPQVAELDELYTFIGNKKTPSTS
jgi:transposase